MKLNDEEEKSGETEDTTDRDVHHDESRRNGFDEHVAEKIGSEESG